MAIENMRGCGFRKVGGLYLVGDGQKTSCDRLPYKLKVCPVCNEGIKFSRGFSWLDWNKYAGKHSDEVIVNPDGSKQNIICKDGTGCYICNPLKEKYGLLWVGESFYPTPQDFVSEAKDLGISKRIAAVPRDFKAGETVILLAHKKVFKSIGIKKDGSTGDVYESGVFYSFIPNRVEKLIWESDAVPELLNELLDKDITPVIIPDGDPDHDPASSRVVDKDRLEEAKISRSFNSLRDRLKKGKTVPGSAVTAGKLPGIEDLDQLDPLDNDDDNDDNDDNDNDNDEENDSEE